MSIDILQRLTRGVVLGDGGYLLELEKRGYVHGGPFTPEVSLTHPEALAQLHREFLHAGAEVLQALTFYASEAKLATVGLAGQMAEINRAAVRIARTVAAEGNALVAGTLSLTWDYDPGDPGSADRVRALFDQQLEIQVPEGIDLVIGETFTWLGEALLAVERGRQTSLPVMATMAFGKDPRSREGFSPAECARQLFAHGADIVGINCLRSPRQMLPLMREMRHAVSGPLACQPAAFHTADEVCDFTTLPEFPFGLDPLQLPRSELGAFALEARALGINYLGACCGAVAAHIRAMARALGKLPAADSPWQVDFARPRSAYELHHRPLARDGEMVSPPVPVS